MIFTFEALQAKHGDSLLIHYGDSRSPSTMVIDGGPSGIYRRSLRRRLIEIKDALAPEATLGLPLVMVSHMDDDHVNGILGLAAELRDAEEEQETPPFRIDNLWFNSFDDIIGNIEVPALSGLAEGASMADLAAAVPSLEGVDHHVGAVLASTNQGRRLRNMADLLGIPVNAPFTTMGEGSVLVRGAAPESLVDRAGWPQVQVLHPNENRLIEMQEKWDRDLKKARDDGDDSIIFASFGSKDTSPFNLASIVCLVEFGGKKILLTGDARDDDIINGIDEAGLLDDEGRVHVDVLKIPHHASNRNVSTSFFERVTADHYVISANGKHENPDHSTLVMLSMATRGRNAFTIHMTNKDGQHNLGEVLDDFIQADRDRGRTYGFKFRKEDALSLKIDLLEEITF